MDNNKEMKLRKSNTDRRFCGVCGGLGKYFDVDSTLFRLLFVITTLFACGGLFAYIACAIVIPNEE